MATVLDRKKKIAKDEVSSAHNLPIMFKHPIHGDERIQDVLENSDVGYPEVEVKIVGRSTQIEEFGSERELQSAVSEDEAREGDVASMSEPLAQSHYVEEVQEQWAKDVPASATATTTSQLQTPNAKSKKPEASGPSSPSPGVLNPYDTLTEILWSLKALPAGEAAVHRCMTVEDLIKQLPAWRREQLQKMMTKLASAHNVPIMSKHPIQGDARIQDVLDNSVAGNPEVEVKVVGDARSTQIEEFGSQREFHTAVSEDEAREGYVASMSEPLGQSHYVEEVQEQCAKDVSASATATTTSQLQTPNAKSKKLEASGPSSLSPGVPNPYDTFNEILWSLNALRAGEAAVSRRMALKDLRKQLAAWKREELQELGTKLSIDSARKKKITKDQVSSAHNLPIMFKHPIHGDERIQDVLENSDVGYPEVEVKIVGRSTQIEEFGSKRELQSAVSEGKFFCSKASDLGVGMAWNFPAISSEFCITNEAREGDVGSMSEPLAQSHYVEEVQEQWAKDVPASATATTTSQLQTPNAKSKKPEASGPSSPSSGVLNPYDTFNEVLRSLNALPAGEAAVRQCMALKALIKQLPAWRREELQKTMTKSASAHNVPIMSKHPIQGDARIQDMLDNSVAGNPEVEVKVVGDARSTQIEEFGSQREFQTAVSEDEAREGNVASMFESLAQSHSVEIDQEESGKDVSRTAPATVTLQPQRLRMLMQASGPSSPSPVVLNSVEFIIFGRSMESENTRFNPSLRNLYFRFFYRDKHSTNFLIYTHTNLFQSACPQMNMRQSLKQLCFCAGPTHLLYHLLKPMLYRHFKRVECRTLRTSACLTRQIKCPTRHVACQEMLIFLTCFGLIDRHTTSCPTRHIINFYFFN